MAVDADTKKYLEEVKKGKPRRFVMICKGVKILSMIVFKKGTVEKYKKQAKQEGKGQFYHGVVDGKGVAISFKLCRSDGFDKPPGKDLVLKDFLKTEADMKFKPVYELVDELPDVPEEDEDEQLKDSPTDSGKVAPEPTSEPAPATPATPEGDPAERFKERLTALLPQIKQAVGTTAGDEAKLKASEAGVFARKQEFEQALGLLDQVEVLLKEAPTPAPEPSPMTDVDAAETFKNRLTSLLPQIKQAVGTTAGDEAKLKASEAGVLARKKEFEQALALLDEVETLLKQASSQSPTSKTSEPSTSSKVEPPPAPVGDPAELFKERLTALLPQIKQSAGTTAGDEAKLKASEAGVLARKKEFEQALALLDEVETLLAAPGTSTEETESPDEPPVDWETAKSTWQDASDAIDSQIAALQNVLKKSDDEELVDIAEFGLNAVTGNFKVPLMAAMRDIDSSQGEARAKAVTKAMDAMKGFRQHVESSDQVKAVDNNPFGVEVNIQSTLDGAFTTMRKAFQSMTAN